VKLGDVIRKERERRGITPSYAAECLRLSIDEYEALERGDSSAERWGPLVARCAITFAVPMARLLSPSGRSESVEQSQVGTLFQKYRLGSGLSVQATADELGIDASQYEAIEAGVAPVGQMAAWLLAFGEMVDQPVFNFFFPCGLSLERIDDYP
jgi:transcriptional regulator with XRE-family HTH domain